MNYRPPVAPFAFEPVMSLGSKRFHGLQLTYDGEDALGYRPQSGHRPPDIGLLVDLVAGWHEQAPGVNFTFPCSFPEVAVEGFADDWLSAARRASIEPSLLELGLDPAHLPSGGADLAANLTQLREAGVGICQLDFGTGYASIATWRQVPLTRIEIPPSFFESQSASAAAMLNTIFRTVNTYGYSSSARGVANEAQLQMLEKLDCQLARGPAIAPRLKSVQVDFWLETNKSRIGAAAD